MHVTSWERFFERLYVKFLFYISFTFFWIAGIPGSPAAYINLELRLWFLNGHFPPKHVLGVC